MPCVFIRAMYNPFGSFVSVGLTFLVLGACAQVDEPEPDQIPEEWESVEPLETDAGRVTLHRMNNRELENTLQTLLISDLEIAGVLPADPMAGGFDNNADALTLSTLYLETVETAVDLIIADALRPPISVETVRLEPDDETWSGSGLPGNMGAWDEDLPAVTLYHGATQSTFVTVDHDGPYSLRISACHEMWGNSCASQELPFWVGGEVVATFDVGNGCKTPETFEGEITLTAGEVEIAIGSADTDECGGSHHMVDWIELEGPLDASGELPPGRAKLYICDPEPDGEPDVQCARSIVQNFMDEAWRRPVTEAEVDEVMVVFSLAGDSGSDVHESIAYAIKRTLLSPWFLFRVEVPDAPEATVRQPLSAHELAARLSYTLWSNQPDDVLRALANTGELLDLAVLEEQTRRMLLDPQAEALVDGFGAQWLGLQDLAEAMPDGTTFPTFDDSLREAMDLELRDLIRRSLIGSGTMLDLLTAETSWLEPVLADHYGVTMAESGYSSVPGRAGGGLFTTAAFLTGTSSTTRTSPVRRGHWVLSNIMCEEPPPAPDGVEQEFDQSEGADTIVEQLAAHRANPACSGCHDQMDPIGVALEGFNAIGLLRSVYDDGTVIETSGELDGIGSFTSVVELASALSGQARTHRCMVKKTYTYALGRATRAEDWPFIAPVEKQFLESGYQFVDLMVGIVQSEPFRTHRGGD
jgi:hypothetical protein